MGGWVGGGSSACRCCCEPSPLALQLWVLGVSVEAECFLLGEFIWSSPCLLQYYCIYITVHKISAHISHCKLLHWLNILVQYLVSIFCMFLWHQQKTCVGVSSCFFRSSPQSHVNGVIYATASAPPEPLSVRSVFETRGWWWSLSIPLLAGCSTGHHLHRVNNQQAVNAQG